MVSFLILGPFGQCSAQVAVLCPPDRLLGGGLRHRRDLSGWKTSGTGFDTESTVDEDPGRDRRAFGRRLARVYGTTRFRWFCGVSTSTSR